MNKRFLAALRIEDALCVFMAVLLLGYLGANGFATVLRGGGDNYWAVSFILLPLSILIFTASLRYALATDETPFGRLVGEVLGFVRDWLPFLLFILFYTTFHVALWVKIHPQTYDAQLLAIDRALMGETPAVAMQRWISPGMTNLMTVCYFLHLVFPPLVAWLLYRRDLKAFRALLLAILIAGALGSIGYLIVPAIGPGAAYPLLFSRDLNGVLYQPIVDWLDVARAPRDVFPSLHVAISAIVLWYSAKRGRVAFAILAPFVIGNWISTMYLRYHYFIDDIAGLVTAAISIAAAAWLLRVELRAHERFAGVL